jgi:hypothetical protein
MLQFSVIEARARAAEVRLWPPSEVSEMSAGHIGGLEAPMVFRWHGMAYPI